ncbi:MAG: helix-turn-helix domain-containing protein [Spirochaetales bacterium]|nr:helix-turn-helix domain-containing protein [Spirochaetales bacterium]
MESIGDKLRQKREELSVSIDQVARDTNIAKAYLVALENEKFEEFPGETYLVGFLRNYSEYLGLNAEEVITLYKSFKIQEQPIPMDELLDSRKIPWLFVGIIVSVIVILGAGGFLLFPDLFMQAPAVQTTGTEPAVSQPVQPQVNEPAGIVMDEDILEQRFEEGALIRFAKGNSIYEMRLSSIDTNVTIQSAGSEFILALGQEEMLDLDGSDGPDIYVLIRDIDGSAAVIRFDRQVIATAASGPEEGDSEQAAAGDEPAAGESEQTTTEAGTAQIAAREKSPFVIMKASKAEPFTLMIHFRGYCLCRYELDDKTREERYYKKDDVLKLDAMKQVRVWLSNGGNAAAKISGNAVEFGRPGEVSTGIIRWENRQGEYELTFIPVY